MCVKDPVFIKSNRYGLTLYFDHDMPYEELLKETREKFRSFVHFFNHADMAVEFEGRAFTKEEEQMMVRTIQDAAEIQIICIIEKDTCTEEIHKRMLEESLETLHDRDGQFYRGTLRGRQILESETSIVIVGDIEEGAVVASKHNVIITGSVYGTVIAGAAGDYNAIIAAHHMEPKKLCIGDIEVKPVRGGSYSWAKLL